MSKVFIQLTLLILLFFIFLYLPRTTLADPSTDCTFRFYETADLNKEITPNQNMGDLTITINSNILTSGTYRFSVHKPNSQTANAQGNIIFQAGTNSSFNFSKPAEGWQAGNYQIFFFPDGQPRDNPNSSCKKTFSVLSLAAQSCITDIENRSSLTPGTSVKLSVKTLQKDCYDILVNGKLQPGAFCADGKKTSQDLGTFPASKTSYTVELKTQCLHFGDKIGTCLNQLACNPTQFLVNPVGSAPTATDPMCNISPDPAITNRPISSLEDVYVIANNLTPLTTYNIWTRKQSDPNINPRGSTTSDAYGNLYFLLHNPTQTKIPTSIDSYEVRIYNKDDKDPQVCSKPYAVQDANLVAAVPAATPCTDPAKCSLGGGKQVEGCNIEDPKNPELFDAKHPGIPTAIGCIHTNPAELAKDIMTWVIGIGGGLAFLMMILGAFQMITSAGNPETLNAGKERLTSAVIGLLMVIFAILLLQIIGVDILKIPGFGRS